MATVLLLFLSACACAAADDPVYGSAPWLWFGSPVASPQATVTSPSGKHRFTVLAPALLRLEFSPGGVFEDSKTLAVWNRNLPVPDFTASVGNTTTIIDTGAVLLTFRDDGAPFSDSSLTVLRRGAAFWEGNSSLWVPSLQPASDPGQLFGTFHNLDGGHNGYEKGGLNCTLLDPNAFADSFDYFPCDWALFSKAGFAVVDDSRAPVWDEGAGWLTARPGSVCAASDPAPAPCFPGGWDTSNADFCVAAGCCPGGANVLSLWYSKARNDHFSDSANCSACQGLDYKYLHAQAGLFTVHATGLEPLNLYWNANPADGAEGDNVASTFPPEQPGYAFARVEGYVYQRGAAQPPGTVALKLWFSAAGLDHWTTAGPADEAAAAAAGYTLVGLVGYAPPPPAAPAPAPPSLRCTAPSTLASSTDWYLFSHGLDYAGALADYVSIAGPVALPRRHWMGVSWSTWDESLNRSSTLAQVQALKDGGWPLDTFIFDMEWHMTPAWGGYQWDTRRYGDVPSLLSTLHGMGLALGMNLHDGDGVQQKDNPATWPAFAAALGLPANATGASFEIGARAYADALAGAVMAPLMAGAGGAPPEGGLDLCWTDWQQGFPGVSAVPGLVPTAILNHYRFYNCTGTGRGTRGTLHSRYAGRGDHRHASHFGGDVDETWASLQFMIDFTKTAANAPACWWGHEMMRQGGGINQNSELFVRTNQFGAWSPTFTSWGNSGENNFWWDMPEPFASAMRGSLLDRQRLLPLRYTLAAEAARTGLCPIRGMHFASPLHADAYATPGQYLLGPDLIVAPAAAPVSDPPIPPAGGAPGGAVGVRVWVPPGGGDWLDYNDPAAKPVAAGWSTYNASIAMVPVLVRAGAVVPALPRAYAAVWGVSAKNYDSLVFTVFPGAASGGTSVYEDDGATTGFLRGEAATTAFAYAPGGGVRCTAHTMATRGAYPGMVTAERAYTVELIAAPAPAAVTQNGTPLPEHASEGVPGTWARRGSITTVITLLPADTGTDVEVVVCAP